MALRFTGLRAILLIDLKLEVLQTKLNIMPLSPNQFYDVIMLWLKLGLSIKMTWLSVGKHRGLG